MAEQQEVADVDVDEENSQYKYKAPAQKSIQEIMDADQEDESLRKYKEALLGAGSTTSEVLFPEFPDKRVILRKMTMEFDEDRAPMELDLQNQDQLKNMKFEVKEGVTYRLKIDFNVQKEIVSGLKFMSKITRKGIQVDKFKFVMGSYGPKAELYTHTTAKDEFPKGMLARGEYKVHSVFVDDDEKEHCSWDWTFKLKKDWKDAE